MKRSVERSVLRTLATRLVPALLLLAAGCGNPCADLADKTCKRTGKADPLCTKLRAVAEAPTADDVEQCKAGNAFVDELERR